MGWRPATTLRDGVRRYLEWEAERGTPAAPRSWRVRAPLLVGALVRTTAVAGAAVLAGLLAAVLARSERVSDGAGLLGLLALIGLPLALVARIDWTRDRRRAGLVGVAMLAGAAFASLIVSVAEAVEGVVRHHAVLYIAVVIISVVGYAARPAAQSG